MGRKTVTTTKENASGRNTHFKDNSTGKEMSRAEFVNQIEQGKYLEYHVRKVIGIKTPISNPDGKEGNNLD